jgi:hypothetical protein
MTATFERRIQKCIYDFLCFLCTDISCGQTDDICIIVRPCELSDLIFPGYSCAYFLMFIGSHSDTIGSATDEYTEIRFACFYIIRYRMGEVWVVYRVLSIAAFVIYLVALLQQICEQLIWIYRCLILVNYCSTSSTIFLIPGLTLTATRILSSYRK